MEARIAFMLRWRPNIDSTSEDNDVLLNHTSLVSQCLCSFSLRLIFDPSYLFHFFYLFSPSLFFSHVISIRGPWPCTPGRGPRTD